MITGSITLSNLPETFTASASSFLGCWSFGCRSRSEVGILTRSAAAELLTGGGLEVKVSSACVAGGELYLRCSRSRYCSQFFTALDRTEGHHRACSFAR